MISRRVVLATSGLTLAMPSLALGQSWPGRPVTVVVPWAAGGGADTVTRILTSGLELELKVPVNVVNRTGGNGVVGHTAILSSRPDGYTLGLATSEISYFRTLGMADIAPDSFDILSRVATIPAGVTVRSASPWRNIQDFLTAVRSEPKGHFTASGAGLGASWHIALAGMLRAVGLEADRVRWVPSQGGAPAMQEVAAGGITIATCSPVEGKALIDAGQARCLAVMGTQRLSIFPDVPTLKESGTDYAFENWFALVGPRGLPEAVHGRLLETAARAHARPEVQDMLKQRGIVPVWETPQAAEAFARNYATTAADLLGALGLAKG
ncbi:Bug family tripartite tricarboxylate transporter substrate binding protein [Roseomonas marmotae]|uniref:Tripartite tricarboxylate transporter substrate binding protein n=1 Tax=Roseomonas marmotae TaxID=2768161 RepID=A0ABS3K984_9PROT|nr:tripartite tricarboxylate transporter substrate binding protein [Roseomonas marmotae]MBO1073490.1 tripartite tricarboxylate transporter substrate binding protein [Roseomonas marmotae]QTI80319.1 tripartite tricarboxylate transporter substrate binding protein [Roseomonas marmotae]